VTTVLVASCFVMAGLFLIVASSMHGLAFRRAAGANIAAALCCALGGAVVPLGLPALPVAMLLMATSLGASSLHAARTGRG
jgi:hypothetical protein